MICGACQLPLSLYALSHKRTNIKLVSIGEILLFWNVTYCPTKPSSKTKKAVKDFIEQDFNHEHEIEHQYGRMEVGNDLLLTGIGQGMESYCTFPVGLMRWNGEEKLGK